MKIGQLFLTTKATMVPTMENDPSPISIKNGKITGFNFSRESLYEQVWATPMNHLAETFGVSGSYLARVCEALNIPRPPVGYWQKKAVGKAKPRPDLPALRPGDQTSWSKNKLLTTLGKRTPRRQAAVRGVFKTGASQRHPMTIGIEGDYLKTRKIEDNEFLKPYKKLLPDIVASKDQIGRAVQIASDLYDALEQKGHRVLFAPSDQNMKRVEIDERETPRKDRKYGRYSMGRFWSPHRPTVTYVGTVPIGLALIEMTKRVTLRYVGGKYVREDSATVQSLNARQLINSWTTEQDVPCGRFRVVTYSPIAGVDWVKTWQETASLSIERMMPDIVRALEGAKGTLSMLMTAADDAAARQRKKWDEDRERWQFEEHHRRTQQSQADSRKQLEEIMNAWASATAVERFFQEAEQHIEGLEGERREHLSKRLTLARSMLGTLDPLEYLEGWLAPHERYKQD